MIKILMIEDEVSFSETITFLLKKEGFDVTVANNGQDGLNLFEKNGADLILLDLMLPGLSGTEVCRQIRLKSMVPIIMLTARDSEIDKVVGLELGADDYITKPFSKSEMARAIFAEEFNFDLSISFTLIRTCGNLIITWDNSFRDFLVSAMTCIK